MVRRFRRSRKGAWIEILGRQIIVLTGSRRSRKGAWIEIRACFWSSGIEDRRSRKGAWIEIRSRASMLCTLTSLP